MDVKKPLKTSLKKKENSGANLVDFDLHFGTKKAPKGKQQLDKQQGREQEGFGRLLDRILGRFGEAFGEDFGLDFGSI